ncbi:MAG: alpha-hydroxy-acid oxidizing protein [Chloroflexi bacterium]|nr:alpha-hydroxy-acid oxidizing protein [Chloroflexota bacterium]
MAAAPGGEAVLNVRDVERIAAGVLSPGAAAYYNGGAWDESTLRDNEAAFERWRFRPKVLVDVARRDLSVRVLGRLWPTPFGTAPMALMRLATPEGEGAAARACRDRGITYTLSTVASATIEEVAEVGGPRWFQLYTTPDADWTMSLVRRAEAAGYEALVMTVDAAPLGRRERDARVGLTLPPGVRYENLVVRPSAVGGGEGGPGHETGADGEDALSREGPQLYAKEFLKEALTPADLAWLVRESRLPVIVKGVLRGDDADAVVEAGAAGVWVSNHGGRQMDRAIASIDALPDVVQAVRGRVPVLFDGGIRRGMDALAALALGATAVFVGRPLLWGLAWDGERGAGAVLDMLTAELDLAMAITGVPRASSIDPSILVHADLAHLPRRIR